MRPGGSPFATGKGKYTMKRPRRRWPTASNTAPVNTPVSRSVTNTVAAAAEDALSYGAMAVATMLARNGADVDDDCAM
jgi:hypothetical protein